jgi:S-methylmethionine-dependent homocysteine/selenocysteine methylase
VVRQIHVDNLDAGADIITTNTFRTTPRTLRAAGLPPARAASLTKLAVELAYEARAIARRPEALIAGSLAPLEDCYSPWLTPPPAVATSEHRAQAARLAEAAVDFLMIETMPTIGEAEVALESALATGLPVTVGFVCRASGPSGDEITLVSGESLADAVRRVEALSPAAILVNCAAPGVITDAIPILAAGTSRRIGGYANLGTIDPVSGWAADESISGADYADQARLWLEAGAGIVGGCCGTTTAHTAALRRLIDQGTSRDRAGR